MSDITLNFGKHKGKKLSQVPTDYVRWLSEQGTICGKKDIPQAAKEFIASLPKEVANATRYSKPTTAEEAEKLVWMAGKGNKEAARTMQAARGKDGFFPVDFEDSDGEIGYFFVSESGTFGYYAGTQADIDERAREEDEHEKDVANWLANPTLQWDSKAFGTIKVWADSVEQPLPDQCVMVEVKGHRVMGMLMEVPSSQRAQARANGIVAVIGTRIGDIGLTAERKAKLDTLL